MRTKLSLAFEILWVITAILCLFAGIHQTYFEGFTKSNAFFIFSSVAFIMYLLRRQIRKTNKDNTNG
jgi:hypothetical protein